MKRILLLVLVLFCATSLYAQFMTHEDSLTAGLNPTGKNVVLSGYGQAKYSYNQNDKTAEINLTRAVLFIGYRFNKKITFFSELEVEDTKVDPNGGELAMEQCVLKLDLNRNHYLMAGLFIPRIGIMNENHLPTTFNGNDRHFVERFVIPATWRELGIGYYGNTNRIPGLNWSLGIMNGLNSANITAADGIREARAEGREASASNLAVTGSLLYYYSGIRLQWSGYYGGSVGLAPKVADTLGLAAGPFGTPVGVSEFNVQYHKKGFTLKGLAAYCTIPDAEKLNKVYNANAANSMYGYMVEFGYNVLQTTRWTDKQLNLFARYEAMDMTATVPENGLKEKALNKNYFILGATYLPVRGVAFKLDWIRQSTADSNIPVANVYQLGMAYSF